MNLSSSTIFPYSARIEKKKKKQSTERKKTMPFRTCGPPQDHNLFFNTCHHRIGTKTACLLRFRFFTFPLGVSFPQSFKNPNYTKEICFPLIPLRPSSPSQNSPHCEHLEPRNRINRRVPSGTYLSTNRLLLITDDDDSRFSNYR